MKREIFQEIEIPEGIEIKIEGNLFTVKGEKGETKKKFNISKLVFEKRDKKIFIGNKNASKKDKRMINTIAAHVKNMIKGVAEGYEYKLKVANSHFPMNVAVQGNEVVIKNFLGEKVPRKLKIVEGSQVKIEGDIITVTSHDKEIAGQTAANFEKATRIRLRDRRVFQDGIFMTNKAGKEI